MVALNEEVAALYTMNRGTARDHRTCNVSRWKEKAILGSGQRSVFRHYAVLLYPTVHYRDKCREGRNYCTGYCDEIRCDELNY